MSISKTAIAATGIFAAVSLTPITALSQDRAPCQPDDAGIIALLEKEYGEDVIATAVNSNGHLVRWLVSERTRTWSMVVSLPNGAGCLVASGKHFEPSVSAAVEPAS